jgi:hypothetical protein
LEYGNATLEQERKTAATGALEEMQQQAKPGNFIAALGQDGNEQVIWYCRDRRNFSGFSSSCCPIRPR